MTTNLSKQDRLPQIRVFVAVELPEDLREHLGRLRSRVGPAAQTAKWVGPDLLHITVRFLGEMSEERVKSVETATVAAASALQPFELVLARMGAFPHARSPRVLWVGLESDAGFASLQHLHAEVENRLDQQGFGREQKPFSPHITLARLPDRSSSEQRRALGDAWVSHTGRPVDSPRSFPVNAVTVMSSDLRSGGPHYTALARVPLGRTGEARRGVGS
jgi:2'-5' RNA ligase